MSSDRNSLIMFSGPEAMGAASLLDHPEPGALRDLFALLDQHLVCYEPPAG